MHFQRGGTTGGKGQSYRGCCRHQEFASAIVRRVVVRVCHAFYPKGV
jgi:hypothetical protein